MAEPAPLPAAPPADADVKAFAPDGQKITIKAGDADALVRAGGSVATQQEIVDDKYGNTMNPLAQAALGGIGVGLNPQLRSLQLGGEQGLTGGLSKVFQKEAVRALAGDEVAKKYVQIGRASCRERVSSPV